MNRSLKLLYRMLEELQKVPADIPRDETLAWETVHMISSARTAWILALSRGEDPELCACAAAVHDFGRIRNGVQAGHAEAGFLPVTAFLKETGLFTDVEIGAIAQAVRNHSRKTETGTGLEEIVKDADVIDCFQYGLPFDRPEKEERYEKWLSGLTADGTEKE